MRSPSPAARVPSVAVVIATFNRGSAIARTLDSVRAQTRSATEIIVVDDGSTDGTADWITTAYPDVRVVRSANERTSAARNRGARAATSDVLVFLDHDDDLHPHAIETLVDLLARWPGARAAFADHTYRNVETGDYWPNHHAARPSFARLRSVKAVERTSTAALFDRRLHRALLSGNLLQQPWAIYRETFLALGGFAQDICFCEDWELYLRVAEAVPVAVSDTVIANHVVEGGNLHLAPGQDEMQMAVLQRQRRMRRVWEMRALMTIRSRLAMYYKGCGDTVRGRDAAGAHRWYLWSFALWPFDVVVAARTLLWTVRR